MSGLSLYTERNEVVKSWDYGRVWILSLYVSTPNETKPLSHRITAAFGSVYIVYTERNEAVTSWDNGCVWLGIYQCIPSETRLLRHAITAVFGSVYISVYRAKRSR